MIIDLPHVMNRFEAEYVGDDKTDILDEIRNSDYYAGAVTASQANETRRLKTELGKTIYLKRKELNATLAPSYSLVEQAIIHCSPLPRHINETLATERACSMARLHFKSEFTTRVQRLIEEMDGAEAQLAVLTDLSERQDQEHNASIDRDLALHDKIRDAAGRLLKLLEKQKSGTE